jgi:hypothetical protein
MLSAENSLWGRLWVRRKINFVMMMMMMLMTLWLDFLLMTEISRL